MKKLLPLLALLLLCAGCGFLDIQIGTAATTAVTTVAATTKATTAATVTAAATTKATTAATTAKTTAATTTTATTDAATTAAATTAAATTAATTVAATAKPWQDPYPAGISGWFDVPAYLEGDWWLLPKGRPEQSQNTMLFFREEEGILSACFMR